MKVNFHDSMRAAVIWHGARPAGISGESHVAQSMRCAFEVARVLGRARHLCIDHYFLVVPALRTMFELNRWDEADGLGAGLVQIVIKARSGCTF